MSTKLTFKSCLKSKNLRNISNNKRWFFIKNFQNSFLHEKNKLRITTVNIKNHFQILIS
ncbi:hypothetical protein SAMN05444380_11956 [Thermophagus xiamenensis]|uniref:Uncharacterized protein n=1 Tax=Thermophagus xiamenensis TaxID=385682 RepID=A0A1I2DMM0_9BACT|nr:hypothetical protein SAMN05444380_11956 [Thermophagus xiamenensis]